MGRPNLIFVFAIVCAMASATTFAQQQPLSHSVRAKNPDVFLITIDTLRADHVHRYGDASAETPALVSRLALHDLLVALAKHRLGHLHSTQEHRLVAVCAVREFVVYTVENTKLVPALFQERG